MKFQKVIQIRLEVARLVFLGRAGDHQERDPPVGIGPGMDAVSVVGLHFMTVFREFYLCAFGPLLELFALGLPLSGVSVLAGAVSLGHVGVGGMLGVGVGVALYIGLVYCQRLAQWRGVVGDDAHAA